jgi:hypothetical protein
MHESGGASLVMLQAKAALADALATELRLYRGFVSQFDGGYEFSRLFAPLAAYDALFGDASGD